jgi:hypothetical protein
MMILMQQRGVEVQLSNLPSVVCALRRQWDPIACGAASWGVFVVAQGVMSMQGVAVLCSVLIKLAPRCVHGGRKALQHCAGWCLIPDVHLLGIPSGGSARSLG